MDIKQPEEDFNGPIHKTSSYLAKFIVEQMLENFDLFMEGYDKLTEEQLADLDHKRINFTVDLLAKMTTTDIPSDYASFPIQKIIVALTIIQNNIERIRKSWDEEILSRTFGVTSPLDKMYNREYATLKDVMNAVTKVRQVTGVEMYNAINKEGAVNPAKLSTDETGLK